MKLFKFILLYLFLISSVQADTIYQLIKIPNLEIYNIKTTNSLRYLYAKQPFTIGVDNNINCFKSSKQDLDQKYQICLLYTSPSPRDRQKSRMPSSA